MSRRLTRITPPARPAGAAAHGFIGGVVPKKAAKPDCPAWATNTTCAYCAKTAKPSDCFECMKANQYAGNAAAQYCAGCANLTDASLRGT